MNCPVEVTDYDSSLIAADWYEEQGDINQAESFRYVPTNTLHPERKNSNSRSSPHGSWFNKQVSHCNHQYASMTHGHSRSKSGCRSSNTFRSRCKH